MDLASHLPMLHYRVEVQFHKQKFFQFFGTLQKKKNFVQDKPQYPTERKWSRSEDWQPYKFDRGSHQVVEAAHFEVFKSTDFLFWLLLQGRIIS